MINNRQPQKGGGGGGGGTPQQQSPEDNNKITPELLVDALSGHEDGLLSIAERLMTHYDAGYDAMGEAIIDAFADVQKLFQHVVEAAHMEGAALERERGEGEWKKRMESLGIDKEDMEGVLYGQVNDGSILDGGGSSPSKRSARGNNTPFDNDPNNTTQNSSTLSPTKSEEHRHEELIDQDVRDVLIDAIKRGQTFRDNSQFNECRSLYESACGNASSLLPVDSDHRGRLQLAVARAESMSADRACSILKYAMDDVLRSGLSLRQGKYPQMDVKERSDCVLSRPNPLRTTPSRGYDINGNSSWDVSSSRGSTSGGGGTSNIVEQSAEEALNSVTEEMKEILGAPVYNLTPLQNVSEKFWLALSEAKKCNAKKEERLEQALAKIKSDFLLAREEYEEQLSGEREKLDMLKRRFNEMRLDNSRDSSHLQHYQDDGGDGALNVPYATNRPQSARSEGGISGNRLYEFDDATATNESHSSSHNSRHDRSRNISSSGQSVVSMGSEFAQKAKSLVHLLNCQDQSKRDYMPADNATATAAARAKYNRSPARNRNIDEFQYERSASPR